MKNCKLCDKKLTKKQTKFCSKECKSKFWSKFGDKSYSSQKKRERKRKMFFVKKLGNKCSICNYNSNISALCFHHKNEKLKTFNISGNSFSHKKLSDLNKEIEKCELLCSNCHMEKHHKNQKQNIYYDKKIKLINLLGGKCSKCGYSKSIAALVFHHMNPENKISKLDVNSISKLSNEEINLEVNKCQLLCQNCHAELHHNHLYLEHLEKSISLEESTTKTNICELCGNSKYSTSTHCIKCYNENRNKIRKKSPDKYPEKEDLIMMLKTSSKIKLSKILGISTRTIRNILNK